jgi:hypothetical protein
VGTIADLYFTVNLSIGVAFGVSDEPTGLPARLTYARSKDTQLGWFYLEYKDGWPVLVSR